MKLSFISIQPKDLDQVIGMFKAAAEKIKKMNIDHWQYWLSEPPSEKLQWVKEGLANAEYHFVENENHETVGMVRIINEDVLYWGKQEEKAKYVHSLVVKEQFNGQGLGQAILAKIAQQAKIEGCKYLRLDADSKN
jgi:GNAT superfamily N-acetyltransferase